MTTSFAPGLAGGRERQDGVDRLLARRLDERARVHHDQVGVVGAEGGREPVGQQGCDDLVGVDCVLRAAESLNVETLDSRLTHCTAG